MSNPNEIAAPALPPGFMSIKRLGPPKMGQAIPAAPATAKSDAKLHKVAKQFEAMFLTEMLRMSRPPDKAASGFSTGQSGSTWQVFMDQALGDAAAARGGTGLTKQIEDALRRSQSAHKGADP